MFIINGRLQALACWLRAELITWVPDESLLLETVGIPRKILGELSTCHMRALHETYLSDSWTGPIALYQLQAVTAHMHLDGSAIRAYLIFTI